MGFDIDFGALQHANPFKAYQEGVALREDRDQRQYERERQTRNDQRLAEQQEYERGQQARKEQLAVLAQAAQRLKRVQAGGRAAALKGALPTFQALGIDTTPLAALTEEQLDDANLDIFSGEVEKAATKEWREVKRPDGSTYFIDLNAPKQSQQQAQGPGGTPASAPQTDDVFGALVMQESGGRPGVLGPQTRYGRAEGMTQMLPATAQGMAQKLGVPWRPDLMRGTTPEAAEYQKTLGRAYFEEGLQKYGGDVEKALMYYHGGPDERLWGPKTRTYAKEVLARTQPYQVASTAPAPPPGAIEGSAPQAPEWVDLPGGGQRNRRTGKTEGVPKASGRLSATVVKMQNDLLQDLQAASSVNTVIDRTINQIDQGQLNLGPVTNIFSQGRNIVGASDENSRNFATFRASLEKLRNDSLRLNKGVQTEGDAQRAWKELIANINDERLVRQRLEEIKDLNEQAIALRQDLVNQAREDSGMAPIDTNRFRAKPARNDPGKKPAGRPPLSSFQR